MIAHARDKQDLSLTSFFNIKLKIKRRNFHHLQKIKHSYFNTHINKDTNQETTDTLIHAYLIKRYACKTYVENSEKKANILSEV